MTAPSTKTEQAMTRDHDVYAARQNSTDKTWCVVRLGGESPDVVVATGLTKMPAQVEAANRTYRARRDNVLTEATK